MRNVLFVCMGNICRSPTAEGVFRNLVSSKGLAHLFEIDSCGTHSYHIGHSPDKRSIAAALNRGYDLSNQKSRLIEDHDFEIYDDILAMDNFNIQNLKSICPKEHAHKISLFLNHSKNFDETEVPDPYYGGANGFDFVIDLIEDASNGYLEHILNQNLK